MNRNRALYSALAITVMVAATAANARTTRHVNVPAKRGISYSQLWQHDDGVIAPGDDGKVNILFGASQPQVVCAPLQVCDIELQAGEQVSMSMLATLCAGRSVRRRAGKASTRKFI